jgi:hypothetical protein
MLSSSLISMLVSLRRWRCFSRNTQTTVGWMFGSLLLDHFDQLVQEKLRKDLPIITTKHAQEHLMEADLGFTKVASSLHALSNHARAYGQLMEFPSW